MNLPSEHNVLTTLLFDVSKALKENSIEYYLIGGSAIGAVRDHGIIPWDDDIDIGIQRKNFKQALKIIKDLNLKGTKIYIPSQEDEYDLTFAKIVRDVPRERLLDQETGIIGAYIDIFPLDHTPKNKVLRRIHQLIFRIGHALTVAKNQPDKLGHKWGKIGGGLLKRYVSRLSYRQVYKKRDIFISIGQLFKKSGVFYNFGTPYKNDREIYYFSEINGYKLIRFENEFQPVPKGFDAILTRTYGNYMRPPSSKGQKHLTIL